MEKILLNFLLDLNDKGLINNHDFDYEKAAKAFVNKDENKQLIIADVVVLKGTLCECSWPLIRTGTSEKAEYCGNCGKDI